MYRSMETYFRTEVGVLQHYRAVPELLDTRRYALFIGIAAALFELLLALATGPTSG